MVELSNSKKTYLGKAPDGRKRYALDCFIGAVQMFDPLSGWQDIQPRLAKQGNLWISTGAPYQVEIDSAGGRRIYPDRTDLSKYLRLPAIALFSGMTKSVDDTGVSLTSPNIQLRFALANSGVKFTAVFQSKPSFNQVKLDVDSVGFDLTKLLLASSGLGIPRPRLTGANDLERFLDWKLNAGQLVLDLDFSGMVFPVALQNTTVDVQVGAGANDGDRRVGVDFRTADANNYLGQVAGVVQHHFYRFTGVTLAGTITASNLSLYANAADGGTPALTIYAVDEDNPAAPTTATEFDDDPLTTASATWNGNFTSGAWNDSPSINSVNQELVDSYTISAEAVMFQVKNTAANGNYHQVRMYDNTTAPANTWGAKFHAEYTEGGVFSPYYYFNGGY